MRTCIQYAYSPKFAYSYTCAHIHKIHKTHTHTQNTYICIHLQSYRHCHTNTLTYANTHILIHAFAHLYIHKHSHITRTHLFTHIYTQHAFTQICTGICINTRAYYALTRTLVHINKHGDTLTFNHACVCTHLKHAHLRSAHTICTHSCKHC